MRTFVIIITAIFILVLTDCLPSFAQTCNVTISGASCVGDTLTAHFTGGTLNNLVWLFSNQDNSERPVYFPNERTAAGTGTGAADSQFNNPTSLFVDKQGNVYVADAGNNRIQKWAPGATSGVTVAGGNGEGDAANQLSSPEGVFVDGTGNIYVADTHNWRIQKWATGAVNGVTVAGGNGFGSNANQLYYPTGVFVDANKNIYIADLENSRIQQWKPGGDSGITVAGGNGYGSAANQLAYPKSIYVDAKKNIYIADYFNHRIQKWKLGANSGTTVAGGNGEGNAANQLNYPTGVSVDSAGNIFVADNYNARVQKWAPNATEGVTIEFGAVVSPTGLFVDSKNNIYVTDPFFNVVSEYLFRVTDYNYPTNEHYVGNIKAVATSANGCVDTSNTIGIFIPAKISGIQGRATNLCGGGNFQYTAQFNFFDEQGIYDTTGILLNWVVPKNCTIISGKGTATIKLKIPANFVKGTLKVIGNLCNGSDTFSTQVSTAPYISPINGFAYVKRNEQNLVYSVQPDSNLHFTWSVPNDVTILSGQGTASIKVNWGTSKGDVIVKAATCADTGTQKLHVVFIDSIHHPISQCGKDSLKVSYKGKAPWAIDGKIQDWQSLLGPETGDNYYPYYPPVASAFNWEMDVLPFNNVDYDYPENPENDIRFTSFMHDDYNAYFYLRRLKNSDSSKAFYYFCDVNADGYMNNGEPVFYASFNNAKISALTISSYIPDTTKFYTKGKGNFMVAQEYENDSVCIQYPQLHACYQSGQVNAFPMRGSLKKIFQSDSIPDANKLANNEIFSAAITEKGYGIELAIPWKYLKNWNKNAKNKTPLKAGEIFFYRESLQPNIDKYLADSVKDNAGSCCASVAKSGNVNVTKAVSVKELIPDSLYRFKLSFTNTTNAAIAIQLQNVSYDSHIIGVETSSGNTYPKVVNFYPDYNCNGIVDAGEKAQCLCYSLDPTIVIPGYGTSCINVDIALPDHNFSPDGTFTFESSVLFNIHLEPCDAAGGKVINPVGTVKTKIGNTGFSSTSIGDSNYSKINSLRDVQIYPNPNDGSFKIFLRGNGNDKLILYDVYGRIIRQQVATNSNIIEMHNIEAGVYFLKTLFENGEIITRKIIVQ